MPALLHAQYRIVSTFAVGGEGSWDYVVPDPANIIACSSAARIRVMVVDENDGKPIGEVRGHPRRAHGTAIAEKSGHGFATSGNDSSVVMFDLKTFEACSPRAPPRTPTPSSATIPRPTACSH